MNLIIFQDVEDHVVLLCSLLLGYGLNAYVVIGTKTKGCAHAWVATIGADGDDVTFWESLTAQRYFEVDHFRHSDRFCRFRQMCLKTHICLNKQVLLQLNHL